MNTTARKHSVWPLGVEGERGSNKMAWLMNPPELLFGATRPREFICFFETLWLVVFLRASTDNRIEPGPWRKQFAKQLVILIINGINNTDTNNNGNDSNNNNWIYIYIHTYIHTYIHISISLSLSLYIYIYICFSLHLSLSLSLSVCIYIYIYIYITASYRWGSGEKGGIAKRHRFYTRVSVLWLLSSILHIIYIYIYIYIYHVV